MNNNTYYKSCQSCGRPQTFCKGECCGKSPKGCECQEYGCKHNACIREVNPDCPYTAVIPSVTVDAITNIKDLADCFVHVSNINTTFYIDDKHRIITTWAGTVEMDWPTDMTIEEFEQWLLDNELGLRAQHLYLKGINQDTNQAFIDDFYYDKTGAPFFAGEFEPITGE